MFQSAGVHKNIIIIGDLSETHRKPRHASSETDIIDRHAPSETDMPRQKPTCLWRQTCLQSPIGILIYD